MGKSGKEPQQLIEEMDTNGYQWATRRGNIRIIYKYVRNRYLEYAYC